MSDLSRQEFIDELVSDLEDRLEGHFTALEKRPLENALRNAIERLDEEDQ